MKSLPYDKPHLNEEATLRQPTHEDTSRRHKIPPRRVYEIDDSEYNAASHDAAIGCLTASISALKAEGQSYAILHFGHCNISVKSKLDTRAEINILPIRTFEKHSECRTKRLISIKLIVYRGHEEATTRTCKIGSKLNGNKPILQFFIRDREASPIIGFDSRKAKGLIHI